MDARVDRLYLSPHLDDVALSCGGSIAKDREAGLRVLVVSVFSGQPDLDELGPVARGLHEQWTVDADPCAVDFVVGREVGRARHDRPQILLGEMLGLVSF